ncbi:hypothetical protein K490DRAFT_38207 [Saccharata proteae CBS 121410]|uniref:Uncharacterized protein n=1 Tax=Saccharata proteae CBS 121410 TaxID=1314787 RepID=A0A6A5YBI3_9PEZI|nr:hypothetical protein K490DRAFT_38207 [Saccharata proteae CBS 121410]
MAFSHDGSTAPIVGNPPAPPLSPNKLVKRSSSLRHAGVPERRPVLRRPATSHQRSATLQARPTFMDSHDDIESHCPVLSPREPPEVRWRQYFSTKVNRPETAKKRGLSGEAAIIRRIEPDEKHYPTLLLAGAVKAPVLEIEDSFSQYGDSEDGRSRPQTPLALDGPWSNPAPMPVLSPPVAETLAPPETLVDESRSRRSFTINDILGTIPQPKRFRASNGRSSGNRLVRKLGLRSESYSRPSSGDDIATANEEPRRSTSSSKRDIGDIHRFSPRELYSCHTSRNEESEPPALKVNRPLSAPVPPIPPIPSSYASDLVHSPVSLVFPQPLPAAPYSRPCSGRPNSPAVTRPSRTSTAPSEQCSTLVGSDFDGRGLGSGEDDDTDYQSETVFDSLRTRGTRSITGGSRGPRIETIFDDESPPPTKSKVSALRDLLPKGTFLEPAVDLQGAHAITEEEESVSTPMRTPGPERRGSPTPGPRSSSRFSTDIPSSPPDLRKPLSLGTLEWDTAADGEDDGRWSLNDDGSEDMWAGSSHALPNGVVATPLSLNGSNPTLVGAAASSPGMPLAPHWAAIGDHADRDARSSIFDWSEPPADQSSGNRTPPRPKTVHGKKDTDGRGSRALGRRVPSGLHARSQSVPVVPVLTNKRDTVITTKFGTWGVGSKGVTEDWNDDFDFTGPNDGHHSDGDEKRVDSASSMIVPETIKEQQTNVLANIGLLREWGLLIEELKDLRARGASLDIMDGPYLGMWQEVDAMIDLADQEVDDPAIVPRLSPPSSPGFDADAFDEPPTNTPNSGRTRARSILQVRGEGLDSRASPGPSSAARACRRKSILNTTDDIFSSPAPSQKTSQNTPADSPTATRPRKNSEAVARSVIEALQKRRSTLEPLEVLKPVPATKKVPFDTATLKHIVPYVNGLTRKCKDALRETERLYSSPTQSPTHELGISQIFHGHPDGSPSSRKSRRSRSNHTTNGSLLNGESFLSRQNDLVAHMELMTVM